MITAFFIRAERTATAPGPNNKPKVLSPQTTLFFGHVDFVPRVGEWIEYDNDLYKIDRIVWCVQQKCVNLFLEGPF